MRLEGMPTAAPMREPVSIPSKTQYPTIIRASAGRVGRRRPFPLRSSSPAMMAMPPLMSSVAGA